MNLKDQRQRGRGKFELPDGSYSALDIPDHFQYIIKNYEILTDKSSLIIYVKKKKRRRK